MCLLVVPSGGVAASWTFADLVERLSGASVDLSVS